MEEQLKLYFDLGNALHKFYDGQTLTNEELELIANSSNNDKVMALDLNATKRLTIRTDRSLDNFNKNSNALKIINFNGKKR